MVMVTMKYYSLWSIEFRLVLFGGWGWDKDNHFLCSLE